MEENFLFDSAFSDSKLKLKLCFVQMPCFQIDMPMKWQSRASLGRWESVQPAPTLAKQPANGGAEVNKTSGGMERESQQLGVVLVFGVGGSGG